MMKKRILFSFGFVSIVIYMYLYFKELFIFSPSNIDSGTENQEQKVGRNENIVKLVSGTELVPIAKCPSIPLQKGASTKTQIASSYQGVDIKAYDAALSAHSSADKWITLALAGYSCVDMAINFYETSLRKFEIAHYLIMASDKKACDILKQHQINCFVYTEDKDSNIVSLYGTQDYARKMNIRTFMILDALHLGYNVLHTDIDVYFMRNPFMEFAYQKETYDLALLKDGATRHKNAGFLFIRATDSAIAVYRALSNIALTETRTLDQDALNRVINVKRENGCLRLTDLPGKQFMSGKKYWDKGNRNFIENKECRTCVVIHNNWIISMEAKRYRFREIGMWEEDENSYYSNPSRKYLTFENEITLRDAIKEDIDALKNALAIGIILNRTVILPRFHCNNKRCTILNHLKLRTFEKYFPCYRENSFLSHPKVPDSVRRSSSDFKIIRSETYIKINKTCKRLKTIGSSIYLPANSIQGANSDEILKWFGNDNHSILRFSNLVGAFCCFTDFTQQKEFDQRVKSGFISSDYHQIEG